MKTFKKFYEIIPSLVVFGQNFFPSCLRRSQAPVNIPEDQQAGYDDQNQGNRPFPKDGKRAAAAHQGLAEVYFDYRADDHCKNKGSDIELKLAKHITQNPEAQKQ